MTTPAAWSNRRRSKFNARKTVTGGIRYDSKREAAYAQQLEWRRRAGEIRDIKRQVKLDLKINGIHWCFYTIDFRVELADGRVQYIELKGYPTREWKRTWSALQIIRDQVLEKGAELLLVR